MKGELLSIETLNEIETLKKQNKELKILCDEYEKEHITVFKQWKKDIKILNEYEFWLKNLGAWVYLDKLKELRKKNNENRLQKNE